MFATVLKDHDASVKAWVTRDRGEALSKRLVDYKPDRTLSDPKEVASIRDLLPQVDYVNYGTMPFIETMHQMMGVKNPMTVPVDEYMKKRDALFSGLKVVTAPYDHVVVTQPMVNKARIKELIDKPSTGGNKPVQTVRFGGKTYIINGHHRVVAEMKQGAKGVESSMLDLSHATKMEGVSFVFKDHDASVKAWLTRQRAKQAISAGKAPKLATPDVPVKTTAKEPPVEGGMPTPEELVKAYKERKAFPNPALAEAQADVLRFRAISNDTTRSKKDRQKADWDRQVAEMNLKKEMKTPMLAQEGKLSDPPTKIELKTLALAHALKIPLNTLEIMQAAEFNKFGELEGASNRLTGQLKIWPNTMKEKELIHAIAHESAHWKTVQFRKDMGFERNLRGEQFAPESMKTEGGLLMKDALSGGHDDEWSKTGGVTEYTKKYWRSYNNYGRMGDIRETNVDETIAEAMGDRISGNYNIKLKPKWEALVSAIEEHAGWPKDGSFLKATKPTTHRTRKEEDPSNDNYPLVRYGELGGYLKVFTATEVQYIRIKNEQKSEGFSHVFKDHDASVKAWLSRARRAKEFDDKNFSTWIKIKHVVLKPAVKDAKGKTIEKQVSEWQAGDGSALDAATKARIAALPPIPPAWSDIRLNPDPVPTTQVIGRDANSKRQIRQHTVGAAENADVKWSRVNDFHKTGVGALMTAALKDMQDRKLSQQKRDVAAIIDLVAHTGFRIGSDSNTFAKEQAYGASTLEKKHIKTKGDDISFSFVGKKGVDITKTITDGPLATYLRHKMSALKASDEVFTASDGQARKYIHDTLGNDKFKPKDFRTWQGTGLALALRKSMSKPTTAADYAAKQKLIAERVAEHLGNTPTVALKSYISPAVWAKWDATLAPKPKTKTKKYELPTDITFQDIWDAMEEASNDPEMRDPEDTPVEKEDITGQDLIDNGGLKTPDGYPPKRKGQRGLSGVFIRQRKWDLSGADLDESGGKFEDNFYLGKKKKNGLAYVFGADPIFEEEPDVNFVANLDVQVRGTTPLAPGLARIFKAAPAPTYVSRKLTNAQEVIDWAKKQGFTSTLLPEDMHTTIAYSSKPVDLTPAGKHIDELHASDGVRSVGPLGTEGAVVLKFTSPELQDRWQAFRDVGASWDYEGYQPHVTISYKTPENLDLGKVTPFAGVLKFGPEVHEPITKDKTAVAEKSEGFSNVFKFHNATFDPSKHPHLPPGPRGGQFTFAGNTNGSVKPSGVGSTQVRSVPATENRSVDGGALPHYGKPIPGAVSVAAIHYSQKQRDHLSGAFYGTGLRGMEMSRLKDTGADPRIKKRIYFYVDEGNGVVPEAGVGGYGHKVRLDNLYDPTRDSAAIWRKGHGDANASEKAIIDAGYDGYYVKNFANKAGVAVLLGDHNVPVQPVARKAEGLAHVFKDHAASVKAWLVRDHGKHGKKDKKWGVFGGSPESAADVASGDAKKAQKVIKDLLEKQKKDDLRQMGDRGVDAHKVLDVIAWELPWIGSYGKTTKFVVQDGKVLSGIEYKKTAKEIHVEYLGSTTHGQGTAWMKQLEKEARASNIKKIKLTSLKTSRPFYEKLGFVPYGKPEDGDMVRNIGVRPAFKAELDDDVGALAVSREMFCAIEGVQKDEGLSHIFKTHEGAIKAWLTRDHGAGGLGKFVEHDTEKKALFMNELLGSQYYKLREALGQNDPKVQEAYLEWQKAKDLLTGKYGYSKSKIGDLSHSIKTNLEKVKNAKSPEEIAAEKAAADALKLKTDSLTSLSNVAAQHGNSSDQAKAAFAEAQKNGATSEELAKAYNKADEIRATNKAAALEGLSKSVYMYGKMSTQAQSWADKAKESGATTVELLASQSEGEAKLAAFEMEKMAKGKAESLVNVTAAIATSYLGSDEYKNAVAIAEKFGATQADIGKAISAAAVFTPDKPVTGADLGKAVFGSDPKPMSSDPTTPEMAKANLKKAYLATLGGYSGPAELDLKAALASATASGLTKGTMAALKAHATMAFQKNKGALSDIAAGTPKVSLAPTPDLTSQSNSGTVFADLMNDSVALGKIKNIAHDVGTKLTYSERGAIAEHTGSGFQGKSKEAIKGKTTHSVLVSALDHEIGVDVQLRRNMAAKWFFKAMNLPHEDKLTMKLIPQDQLDALVGKVYREPAFSSTTYNLKAKLNFTSTADKSGALSLMIRAPKTTKGSFVGGGEEEILLQQGTTYVIRKITKTNGGTYDKYIYTVEADAIGATPKIAETPHV